METINITGYALTYTSFNTSTYVLTASYQSNTFNEVVFDRILTSKTGSISVSSSNIVVVLEKDGVFYGIKLTEYNASESIRALSVFSTADISSPITLEGANVIANFGTSANPNTEAVATGYSSNEWTPSQISSDYVLPIVDSNGELVGWYPNSEEAQREVEALIASEGEGDTDTDTGDTDTDEGGEGDTDTENPTDTDTDTDENTDTDTGEDTDENTDTDEGGDTDTDEGGDTDTDTDTDEGETEEGDTDTEPAEPEPENPDETDTEGEGNTDTDEGDTENPTEPTEPETPENPEDTDTDTDTENPETDTDENTDTDTGEAETPIEELLSAEELEIYQVLIGVVSDWQIDAEKFSLLYKMAQKRAKVVFEGIECYFPPATLELLKQNLILHYIITNEMSGELYRYYGVDSNAYLIQSASNSSSSSSMYMNSAFEKLTFLGMDLLRTPFGRFAYEILEQVNITIAVL